MDGTGCASFPVWIPCSEFPCFLCQSVLQGSTVVPVRALCLPLLVCCAGLDPRVWHMLSPASQPLSVPFLSLPFPLALLPRSQQFSARGNVDRSSGDSCSSTALDLHALLIYQVPLHCTMGPWSWFTLSPYTHLLLSNKAKLSQSWHPASNYTAYH